MTSVSSANATEASGDSGGVITNPQPSALSVVKLMIREQSVKLTSRSLSFDTI